MKSTVGENRVLSARSLLRLLPISALTEAVIALAYIRSGFVAAISDLATAYRALVDMLYIQLGLLFLLEILDWVNPDRSRIWRVGKLALILIGIIILVVIPAGIQINARAGSAPHRFAHDGLIQSEEAVNFLLKGRNPYAADYQETPMADWPYDVGGVRLNPALSHYPYLPLTFLIPLPFQALSQSIFGWFDQRLVFLTFFVATLVAVLRLAGKGRRRDLSLILIGLNPFLTLFLIQGRNDILVLTFMLGSIYALKQDRPVWAGGFLGLACATKQFAWLFVPFFLVVGLSERNHPSLSVKWKIGAGLMAAIPAMVMLPFFLMAPSAFIDDVLRFQSGLLTGGYPVRGVGLGGFLLRLGILPDPYVPYPFWIFQLSISAPVAAFLIWRQVNDNTLKAAVLRYVLLMALVLFFSRAFNDNYIGYLVSLGIIGGFLRKGIDKRPNAREIPFPT